MPRRPDTPDTYFQVPLCVLAWGSSPKQRLNAVINFGCLHAGRVQLSSKTSEELEGHSRRKLAYARFPKGFDPSKRCHQETLAGANRIGIVYADFTHCEQWTAAFQAFCRDFEGNHGADCWVRLRRDLVLEARDGKGMTYPELAVLAAILSVLGDRRKPVRITLKTIRHRAMGYRSQSIAVQEERKRADRARPFSEWQLRSTIEALRSRGFFNRATYGRRVTYYGIGQDPEAFRKSIVERQTRRPATLDIQRKLDQGMTEEIRQVRRSARPQEVR